MIKNYFKTAWRSLLRNKSYAAINVAGLSIGIAACLLIFLIVHFETSFDTFHTKKNQIYRVITVSHTPDGARRVSGTPLPLAEGLRTDFPQLKNVAAIFKNGGSLYTIQDGKGPKNKFKEDDAYFAEPQFFDIFDFGWLAGDKKTALAEPNSVVLSQDEADRFFGNWKNAIGKVVRLDNKTDLKVTGILQNTPANTDIPMKVLVSFATERQKGSDLYNNMKDWVSTFGNNNCFIVLPANVSVSLFDGQLKAFVKRHKPPLYVKDGFELQALQDMHYDTETGLFSNHPFSKNLLGIITIIGVFLLIIACVNFINLATAQAVNRSKEVGIRKVLGSNRKQLALQFITETFIITSFAVAIAICIAQIVLPLLNTLLDIHLNRTFFGDAAVWLFLAATIIVVTFLSGFYPALVLSGFNPITALRNKISAGKTSGISLRRVLVVFQFCIAQALVIGTLVIVHQMQFFRGKSLGFNKDAIVMVPFPNDSLNLAKTGALRDQLLQQPGVRDVSYSWAGPVDNSGWGTDFKFDNATLPTKFFTNLKWADVEYFKLYNLEFVAGGPYTQSDSVSGWVINQTLAAKLGIQNPKDAIGKYIKLWDDKGKNKPIVGVVKDFNITSLKDAIPPVLMASWKNVYQKLNIKIAPQNINQTLSSIERVWNNTFPNGLYEYKFLDETVANFYKSEDQLSQLYKIFAGIAIFISCLGLYGLVSFMAVQRTKEVGIRKTLGASVSHIVYLFLKEFTVLVLIAFVISALVGWYFMQQWLQGFTNRIRIGPGIFILAIVISVAIAWATVGYKAIKAALANPVKSLKTE